MFLFHGSRHLLQVIPLGTYMEANLFQLRCPLSISVSAGVLLCLFALCASGSLFLGQIYVQGLGVGFSTLSAALKLIGSIKVLVRVRFVACGCMAGCLLSVMVLLNVGSVCVLHATDRVPSACIQWWAISLYFPCALSAAEWVESVLKASY
eukprot:scpid51852/ scgid30745/ 